MSVKDSSPNAIGSGAVRPAERVRWRLLALQVLAHRSGPASGVASHAATAANAAYDDLVRVAAPLIGAEGVEALTGRACHLVRKEFPWLTPVSAANEPTGSFARFVASLHTKDPAVAIDAAAAVFATLAALLVTIIGESVTSRLLAMAWPDAFAQSDPRSNKR